MRVYREDLIKCLKNIEFNKEDNVKNNRHALWKDVNGNILKLSTFRKLIHEYYKLNKNIMSVYDLANMFGGNVCILDKEEKKMLNLQRNSKKYIKGESQ